MAELHAETPHAPEQPAAQQDPGAYADLPVDVVKSVLPTGLQLAEDCITAADLLPDDLRDALNAVHENWRAH